jgi:hypothetical protein
VCLQASLAAANGAGGGPKKRLGDAVGWFKGLGQAATSIVSTGGGRAADAAEDPEYIKVRQVKRQKLNGARGAVGFSSSALSLGSWCCSGCSASGWRTTYIGSMTALHVCQSSDDTLSAVSVLELNNQQ